MNILYLRSNPIDPDPRVEKEMSAAIEFGYKPIALGWDREQRKDNSRIKKDKIYLYNGEVELYKFNIKAGFGVGAKNIIPLIKWQLELTKWLIKNIKKYDLIHACDFDTVLPALFMKIVFRKKYVYDIFDFYIDSFSVPNNLKWIIKKIDFFAIKNANATIIVNETRKKQIEGAKPKELVVIHNTPVQEDIENKCSSKLNKCKTIFYGGILTDNRMIRETMSICERHPEWEFIIAGFGLLEQECIKKSQQFKNIKFLGKINHKEIIKNTISSDVIFACYDPTVPNHKYSSPNKLYEAMMCRKPIIVCKDTGIDKLVLSKCIGEVCDFNENSLEQAFNKIFEDEERYLDMCKNSGNLYESDYKWDIMKERLKKIYINIDKVD